VQRNVRSLGGATKYLCHNLQPASKCAGLAVAAARNIVCPLASDGDTFLDFRPFFFLSSLLFRSWYHSFPPPDWGEEWKLEAMNTFRNSVHAADGSHGFARVAARQGTGYGLWLYAAASKGEGSLGEDPPSIVGAQSDGAPFATGQ